ncbi:MAG: hypothetical protein AB8B55_12695 [Mariniblastus sp.]
MTDSKMTDSKTDRMDDVSLVDERNVPYKNLSGFQKHHKVPTSAGPGDHRYLCELAESDLDEDLQEVFAALRKSYGLKRKEISVDGPTDGRGVITTPFFNYEINISLLEDNPSRVHWQRSITSIREPGRIFAGPFEEVFGQRFTILEFNAKSPLDLEQIVDHIEDAELDTVNVDYDKDLTWCEVKILDSITSVMIEVSRIRVISRREISPESLLEAFTDIQQRFISTLSLNGIPFLAKED